MIAPTPEDPNLLTIREVAKSLPTKPHIATIWRWIQRGIKGHRLQVTRIGGRTLVSRADLDAFLQKLNGQAATKPSASREKSKRDAAKYLASQGM